MRAVLLSMVALAFTSAAYGEEVRLVSLNIERGYRSDAELRQIGEIIQEIGPASVWAFQEVTEGDIDALLSFLGDDYAGLEGTRGSDYLAIAYDNGAFELLDSSEIFLTEITGGQRKPLWVELRSRDTGAMFYVVNNHFLRGDGDGDDPRRAGEARDLNAWVDPDVPAIAIGDFNRDFDTNYSEADIANGDNQRSVAFDALVSDDIWVWVRPDAIMPTQCNPRYDSVLDFALVAGLARNWPRESRIIDIGCNDDALYPDHLPVELVIDIQ